jgi:flagellar protein FlaF
MQGYAAYAKVHPNNDSYRDLEYKVLGRVTGALINANKDDAVLPDVYNAALWNEKVWNAFRSDLSSEENRLPVDLKDSLISLSIWVGKETRRVLNNATGLDGLININRQIMAGLSSQPIAK